MTTTGLSLDEKIAVMDMMMRLRSTAPMGVVGLIETRNLLADLFPQFKKIRDSELDELLSSYAESLRSERPPADPGNENS